MFDMRNQRPFGTAVGPRRERRATIVTPDTGDERRFAGRRPSEARAFIFASTLTEPLACTIRDQSASGARITVAFDKSGIAHDLQLLPEDFTIVIQRDRVALDCRIAWRHENSLGLRFTSPAKFLPKAPPSAATRRNLPVKGR